MSNRNCLGQFLDVRIWYRVLIIQCAFVDQCMVVGAVLGVRVCLVVVACGALYECEMV